MTSNPGSSNMIRYRVSKLIIVALSVLMFQYSFAGQDVTLHQLTTMKWQNFIDITLANPDRIWVCGMSGLIMQSTDSGENWVRQDQGPVPEWLTSVFFKDESQGWITGSEGSILTTQDGGRTWKRNELKDAHLTDILFVDTSVGVACGLDGMIFRTDNGGQTWTSLKTPISTAINKLGSNSDAIWAVGVRGVVLKSSDRGLTWHKIETRTEETLYDLTFINDKRGWICGRNGLVLFTDNGGLEWESRNVPVDMELCAIAFIDPNNGITAGGSINHPAQFFVTNDGGLSWASHPDPLGKWWKSIECLSDGTCYLAGNDAIARCQLPVGVKSVSRATSRD